MKAQASEPHGVAVRIAACGKTFGDGTRALEPVSLDIARGETMVLLGPSGCGKTTLLRMVAGLERPDAAGRIFFNDADVTDVPIEQRKVGMVFQSYALFPNMNVAENIAYGLKFRGGSAQERKARVAELVALTGIEGLEHRRIDQLSGGQRQRVAIARALVNDPSIILADEPTGNLDSKTGDEIMTLFEDLYQCGHTIILVTHEADIARHARRTVHLRDGLIESDNGLSDIGTLPMGDRLEADAISRT